MAKEKKEKRGKGIGFYLGFFLLLIIAAVLVIFVVMLFMPGTSILGLQYFSNTGTTRIEKTSDGLSAINLANPSFENVEVECGYGEVVIQKSYEYEQNGIYIVNNAKGFVTSKSATNFKLDVSLDGLTNTLKIKVQEPNGFLYFSKDIRVVFNIANENLDAYKNLNFKIKTTDGRISIGGDGGVGTIWPINIKSVDAETGKGNISMTSYAPKEIAGALSLKTNSGNIYVTPEKVKAGSMNLTTESGKIYVSSLDCASDIELKLNNGTFSSTGTIYKKLVADIKDAYVDINEASSGVLFPNSGFNSGVVNIKKVKSQSVNDYAIYAPNGKDTDFNIALGDGSELDGKLYISTTTGSIKIGGEVDSDSYLCTETGNIEAKISAYSASVEVVSKKKGKINLTLPNQVASLTVSSSGGEINLNASKNGSYTFKFYPYDSNEHQSDLDSFNLNNVHLNLEGEQLANPFSHNDSGASKVIKVKSNGSVNFNWA